MSKKFKCYHCKCDGEKDTMIVEELERMNKKVFIYYHPDCHSIKNENKLSKIKKYTGSNETNQHMNTKINILKGLLGDAVVLVDQNGDEHKVKGEYMTTELPVMFDGRVPYLEDSTCRECFGRHGMVKSENGDWINKHEMMCKVPLKVVTNDQNKDKGIVCAESHPCNKCRFKTEAFKFIFDIGVVNNGKITDVIEIYHSNKVKKDKLAYCKENGINLFEISTKDVSRVYVYNENVIKCNKLC